VSITRYYVPALHPGPREEPDGKWVLYADHEAEVERLAARVTGLEAAQAVAFVHGAAWWEFTSTGGTMWQSDRNRAEQEAERRYPAVVGRWPDPDEARAALAAAEEGGDDVH
jgi:hypothetical protein